MGRNTNEILSEVKTEEVKTEEVKTEKDPFAIATAEDSSPNKEDAPCGTNSGPIKMTVFVPRIPNSKNQPPLVGCVNDITFALPRGEFSQVSPAVYEVVTRSLENDIAAEDYIHSVNAQLLARSKQEAEILE